MMPGETHNIYLACLKQLARLTLAVALLPIIDSQGRC